MRGRGWGWGWRGFGWGGGGGGGVVGVLRPRFPTVGAHGGKYSLITQAAYGAVSYFELGLLLSSLILLAVR